MSKYELSLSPNYVPNWGVVEAVRELFQNAIDQQTVMEDNEMFFEYDGVNELRIGNKNSVLEAKSLLMGTTTKKNDERTIGQHGEGYKVATLVLTRLGKPVTFYNYGVKEVWRPRFVNSRKYGTKILTFFTDRKYVWQTVPDHNLTITVEGITPEDYEAIVESNLHLQDVGTIIETPKGRILEEERYKGKVYVNGLYVCDYGQYAYGYDFKPQFIKLDRDRKLVSDFDLQWLSSSMWNTAKEPEKLVKLAKEGKADAIYSGSQYLYLGTTERSVYDVAYDTFKDDYGDNAVPVSRQEEMANLCSGYKAVIVPETYQQLITKSSKYESPKYIETVSLDKRLADWFEGIRYRCTGDEVALFESILDELIKTLEG